jgi:hypothetical protein
MWAENDLEGVRVRSGWTAVRIIMMAGPLSWRLSRSWASSEIHAQDDGCQHRKTRVKKTCRSPGRQG